MRNGAPFSKPRVRLYGATGDAQNYLGAAYSLLFKVRQFCDASGAPVFAMQRTLEDGAVVQAAILGNEEIVSCFPPTYTRGEPVGVPPEPPPVFGGLVWKPEGFVLTPKSRAAPRGWGFPRETASEKGTPAGSLREVIINRKRRNSYPSGMGADPEKNIEVAPELVADTDGKFAPVPKQLVKVLHFGFMAWRTGEYGLKAPRSRVAVDGLLPQFDQGRFEYFWEADVEDEWFVHRPTLQAYGEGSVAAYLLELINATRGHVSEAVPPVVGWGFQVAALAQKENARLVDSPLFHNSDLFREGYRTFYERVNRVGTPRYSAGENIIRLEDAPDDPEELAQLVHNSYMGSAGHAANVVAEHRAGYPDSAFHFTKRTPETSPQYSIPATAAAVAALEPTTEENKDASATVAELSGAGGTSSEVFVGMPAWVAAGSAWWTGDEGTVSWKAPVNRHFVYATTYLRGITGRQYKGYPNPAVESSEEFAAEVYISGRQIRLPFRPSEAYLIGAALTRETVAFKINETDEEPTTVENALILRVALTSTSAVWIEDFIFQDAFQPIGSFGTQYDPEPVDYGLEPKSFRRVEVCSGEYCGVQRVNFSKSGQKAAVTVFPLVDLPTSVFDTSGTRSYATLSRTYRVAGIAHYMVTGVAVSVHTALFVAMRGRTLTNPDLSTSSHTWVEDPVAFDYPAFLDFDGEESVLEARIEHDHTPIDGFVADLIFPDGVRVPIYRTTFAYIDVRDSSKTIRLQHVRVVNGPLQHVNNITRLVRGPDTLLRRATLQGRIDFFFSGEFGYTTLTEVAEQPKFSPTATFKTIDRGADGVAQTAVTPVHSNRPRFIPVTPGFSNVVYAPDMYGHRPTMSFVAEYALNLMPCPPDSPMGYLDHTVDHTAHVDFCHHFAPAILGFAQTLTLTTIQEDQPLKYTGLYDAEIEYAEYKGEYVLSARLGLFGDADAGVYLGQGRGFQPGDEVVVTGQSIESFEHSEACVVGGLEPTHILRSSLDLATILGDEEIDCVMPLGVI